MRLTGGGTIGIRRIGALASPLRRAGDSLVYAPAAPQLESIVFATDRGVEDLVVAYEGHGEIGYDVDLPPTFRLHPGAPGIVEVRDGRGRARLRMRAERAWDAVGTEIPLQVEVSGATLRVRLGATATYPVAVDPVWEGTDAMVMPRLGHSATLLPTGEVLIAGGGIGIRHGEIYDPSTGTFRLTGAMETDRVYHEAVRTRTGEVLLVGGLGPDMTPFAAVETFDAKTGLFASSGPLSTPRVDSTLMLLPDGRVLCAGGKDTAASLSSSEVWDPVTGVFSPSAPMTTARASLTSVPLPDGTYLVAGGMKGGLQLSSAEVFDPAVERFISVAPMKHARSQATLVALPSGNVLAAGAQSGADASTRSEVFDTSSRTFHPTGDMVLPRRESLGLLIPSGKALVTGAWNSASEPSELYDPDAGQFLTTPAGPSREAGTLTLLPCCAALTTGGVLGGQSSASSGASLLLEDPRWVDAHELPVGVSGAVGVRLSSDNVLLLGGFSRYFGNGAVSHQRVVRFRPSTMTFQSEVSLPFAVGDTRGVTTLADGRVFAADGGGFILDPATNRLTIPTGLRNRTQPSVSRLNDGRILITGGLSQTASPLASAEIFDPVSGSVELTASMSVARRMHATATLPSGEVLVAGGWDPSLAPPEGAHYDAEIFNPSTGTFRPTDNTAHICDSPAFPLSDGSVFILCRGGTRSSTPPRRPSSTPPNRLSTFLPPPCSTTVGSC
jgi:hypothetical protein